MVSSEWDERAALGVGLAAGGYPNQYESGHEIAGLNASGEDAKVFHAGTAEKNGKAVTAGGRVLCAVGLGENVSAAQAKAYELVDQISWKDMYFRDDIGYRAVARE